jgi:hypothetical protein
MDGRRSPQPMLGLLNTNRRTIRLYAKVTFVKTKVLHLNHATKHEPSGKTAVYRIVRVTNTTEFTPGDFIERAKVDELCAAEDWNIIIDKANTGVLQR